MTCRLICITGLIIGLRSANERRPNKVTPPFIGWAQNENQPCIMWRVSWIYSKLLLSNKIHISWCTLKGRNHKNHKYLYKKQRKYERPNQLRSLFPISDIVNQQLKCRKILRDLTPSSSNMMLKFEVLRDFAPSKIITKCDWNLLKTADGSLGMDKQTDGRTNSLQYNWQRLCAGYHC